MTAVEEARRNSHAEEEAEIFWGGGEIPEELLFQDPPFFRDPDKGR